jgi:hypothetical protein
MNQKELELRLRGIEAELKPPRKSYISIGPHHAAMLEAGGEQAALLHLAIRELCGDGAVKLYLPASNGEIFSPDDWEGGCSDVARLDEILNRLTS